MTRWLALVLLVALPVAAQDRFPRCRSAQGRSDRGFACADAEPFFSFAPASGAGLGAPCACAAVTGAKGETVTWTRASSAMCTKSASETAIANGDLVLCGNNLPRVMSLGGPLGVLVESNRTNDNLWSDDLSNAVYTSPQSGVAAVTTTAAFATGPTGATNATRLQFPATTGVQYSLRAQAAGAAAARTGSIYVKGNGTSGTIDLVWGGVGAQCAACAFNPTTWTRCSFPTASAVNTWEFGNDSVDCASAARGAIDVLVAGVQSETGAYATSYIPTTTVAAIRSADLGTAAVSVTQQPLSLAWTSGVALPASVTPDRIGVMTRALAGSGDFVASYFQAQYRVDAVGTASNSVTNAGTSAVGDRWAASHVGGVLTAYKNGAQTGQATLANTLTGATILGIGSSPAGASILDGVVSRVCVDPDPNRCR